jgi:hypothetical protein
MKPLTAVLPALAALLFLSGTAFALNGPLTNEDLLALRSAERIAEQVAESHSSYPKQSRFEEALGLMRPILDRPLPAQRQVWVSLGRWAVASKAPTAGAVVLAGLRRDVQDFMSDEVLADIAASLNAETRTRELATLAAERLDAGDSPLEAIEHIKSRLAWYRLDSNAAAAFQINPVAGAAGWGALAAAFEQADVSELAKTARTRADQRLSEIDEPAMLARALIDSAEGQIRFEARKQAHISLMAAMDQIQTLPTGPDRDRLTTDAARLMARADQIDAAAEIAELLDPSLSDEIKLEMVRSHARRNDFSRAEEIMNGITAPHIENLARIAIIQGLARSGQTQQAESRLDAVKDPVDNAEAQAMILAHAEDATLDPTVWRRVLLTAKPGERRSLAIARILSVYGHRITQPGEFRNAIYEDFLHQNDRSIAERITDQIFKESIATGSSAFNIQSIVPARGSGETLYRYSLIFEAADELNRIQSR